MTNQITLEEALKLVSFTQNGNGEWEIGNVYDRVFGDIYGSVAGYVHGDVCGTVKGDIKSHEWQRIETPRQKLKRLVEEGPDREQLLEAFNQPEDN